MIQIDSMYMFSDSFHSFCMRECEREVKEEFPFLRQITDRRAWAYVNSLSSVDLEMRLKYARALVRRFYRGCSPPTQVITPDEEAFWKKFDSESLSGFGPQWEGAAADRCNTSRGHLRKTVTSRLDSFFGTKPKRVGGGEWLYAVTVRGHRIETSLDFGSDRYVLTYHHRVLHPSGTQLLDFVSLMSWLGISSQTTWWTIEESGADAVAQATHDLVQHFFEAFVDSVLIR